jgi:hypothetical protein
LLLLAALPQRPELSADHGLQAKGGAEVVGSFKEATRGVRQKGKQGPEVVVVVVVVGLERGNQSLKFKIGLHHLVHQSWLG